MWRKVMFLEKLCLLAGSHPFLREGKLRLAGIAHTLAVLIWIGWSSVGTVTLVYGDYPLDRYLITVVAGILVPLACHLTLLVGCLIHSSGLDTYLALLEETEHYLSSEGLSSSPGPQTASYTSFLLIAVGCCCELMVVDNSGGRLRAALGFTLSLNYTCTTCLICGYLVDLSGRYRRLVERLAELGDGPRYVGRLGKVKALSRAHGRLSQASEILIRCFSSRVFVLTVNSFVSFVQNIYLFASFGQSLASGGIPDPERFVMKGFLHLLWSYYFLQLTYQLSQHSYLLSKRAKSFNELLFKIMVDDTDEILNNNKLLLHIAMRREVTFTAARFYPLNHTLIHSMIASATTYLVILIQFAEPKKAT